MAIQEFSKTYYRTSNCLTSDIIADFVPVSRIMGVDTSTGMGAVFTAMGTRFDMQYVAKEAFMATDYYEADTRSIDDTPVAEVMRYVRSEIIVADAVPEQYRPLTDKILKGESVYAQYAPYSTGEKKVDVLFLISPATENPDSTAKNFNKVCDKIGKTAFCTNEYQDCGYLLLQMGQTDEANKKAEEIKTALEDYDTIVTDDGYVLDTLLVQLPELAGKIKFIDEFIYENGITSSAADRIVLHESGVIQRLYQDRKIDYKEVCQNARITLPKRSGYDVTDSGLAGGLGLMKPENMMAVSTRRMKDLMEKEHDIIVTSCACEAVGLNCAEKETVVTLLDYICR